MIMALRHTCGACGHKWWSLRASTCPRCAAREIARRSELETSGYFPYFGTGVHDPYFGYGTRPAQYYLGDVPVYEMPDDEPPIGDSTIGAPIPDGGQEYSPTPPASTPPSDLPDVPAYTPPVYDAPSLPDVPSAPSDFSASMPDVPSMDFGSSSSDFSSSSGDGS